MKIESIVEIQCDSRLFLIKTYKICYFHSNMSASNHNSISEKLCKYEISKEDIETLNEITLEHGLLSDDYKSF